MLTSSSGHRSGRYVSYRTAFLLLTVDVQAGVLWQSWAFPRSGRKMSCRNWSYICHSPFVSTRDGWNKFRMLFCEIQSSLLKCMCLQNKTNKNMVNCAGSRSTVSRAFKHCWLFCFFQNCRCYRSRCGSRGRAPGARAPPDPRFWGPKIEHFWALFNFSIIFFASLHSAYYFFNTLLIHSSNWKIFQPCFARHVISHLEILVSHILGY